MKKTCAIYTRVSTNGQNVETQKHELERIARADGYEDILYFTDEGISGVKGRDKRSGLNDLLNSASKRHFSKLYVYSIDRIGRSLTQLIGTIQALQEANVSMYFYTQSFGTIDTDTAQGRLLLNLTAVFAEWERDVIRERVVSGLERAKANGKKLGRKGLADITRKQILAARSQGYSYRKVAKKVGVSLASVARVVAAEEADLSTKQLV